MNTSAAVSARTSKLAAERLSAYYGGFQALREVTMSLREQSITAIIGPSGCGKSTLLRSFNRMNDDVRGFCAEGRILLDGEDILRRRDLTSLRKRVGMVFQRPNPFPLSVYENVAYGPRIHGLARGSELDAIVERSLRATGMWAEVRDRLGASALSLSGEAQQRLCISRLLAVAPEVLLMDEPCSALDPIATMRIEELMQDLKARYTIVIVTHNMQQATRCSDECGFMWLGELVEFAPTTEMFTRPKNPRTEGYVTGRFG
ncbi:MAG: phosphate ABC transporter ATP-binding protein [Planctomycetes bacterium]|nr:phosphate ABC transporter ATP-binding protein [Planctomycetota bacterium]